MHTVTVHAGVVDRTLIVGAASLNACIVHTSLIGLTFSMRPAACLALILAIAELSIRTTFIITASSDATPFRIADLPLTTHLMTAATIGTLSVSADLPVSTSRMIDATGHALIVAA